MNTITKALASGIILTSAVLAAEDHDLEAAIAASLREHQNGQQTVWEREEQLALELSLASFNDKQTDEDKAIAASLLEHQNFQKTTWEREEQLALELSLASLNEKQTYEDAYFNQKTHQINYDEKVAHQLAAQEETEEHDTEIQEVLLKSTYEAQIAAELEAAVKLSLQVEPCKDIKVLIEAAEALAAGTLQKNLELKNYFTNSTYLFKQEQEKSKATTEGTNVSMINAEIERLKRTKTRNTKAFTQAINSLEAKITLINVLKVKFPDYNDAQINDILEEIGK